MKVTVTRSGGFAGLIRRSQLDTDDDPALAALVDKIDLSEVSPHEAQPDRFVYEIEIGEQSAEVGEADLSGPLRDLITRALGGV